MHSASIASSVILSPPSLLGMHRAGLLFAEDPQNGVEVLVGAEESVELVVVDRHSSACGSVYASIRKMHALAHDLALCALGSPRYC